ncbi:MAG TPA: helix-turn-helix domain-containing protein, partial [Clostridiales bacterium]|nr:helix-turn-helix domain-containing protein [Clostridiales bacterium]
MRKTTSDRLKEIMELKGLKQVDILEKAKPISEKLGVRLGKNDLSQYVSGKVEPGQDKLTVLSRALGVSEVWLMGYDIDTENKKQE